MIKLTRNRMSDAPAAHVRVVGTALSDEDRDDIARQLGSKLGKFVDSIERITVRLTDVNGPKGGRDQRCQIKIVLRGLPSIVVNETDATWLIAVGRAVDALAVAVPRRIQRRRMKRLHHRASRLATNTSVDR